MKNPDNLKSAISQIAEKWGDSPDSVLRRPDCYEFAIARESLSRLDQFYSQLNVPGQTQAQAAAQCPPWPAGTKLAGQTPSTKIISHAEQRLRDNEMLSRIDPVEQFLGRLQKRLDGSGLAKQPKVLEAVIALAGQELIADAQSGKSIKENMAVVDRLQSQRTIDQNDRRLKQNDAKLAQNDRRIKLLEEREAKTRATVADQALTAAEKEAAIRQIYGMS